MRYTQGMSAVVSIVLFSLTTLLTAQEANFDTLTYFTPNTNNVKLGAIWIGAVDSFAVRFTPDSTVERYDIEEFQILLSPHLFSSPDDSINTGLRIHNAEREDSPGSVIVSLPITINASEVYPNWKKIDLIECQEVKSMHRSFWLEGNILGSTVVNDTLLGHSFAHNGEIIFYWYAVNLEFAVKAIIKRQKLTSINRSATPAIHPDNFSLNNFPNPFNATTTITFDMPKQSSATLEIFDLAGRRVKTLIRRQSLSGSQRIMWDGKDDRGIDAATGTYLYRLRTNNGIQANRMILLR